MVDIMIPLIPAIAVGLIVLVLWAICEAIMLIIPIPQYLEQAICRLTKADVLVTATRTQMWIEKGLKEHKTDIAYKSKKFTGKNDGAPNHFDGTRYDEFNSVRWGNSNVKFYFPGKNWPKQISRAAAIQRVYEVATIHVSKDGKIKNELLSIAGNKVEGTKTIKAVLDKLGITKDHYTVDPDAIIKHNEYLCLIAEANKYNALRLIREYANVENSSGDVKSEALNQLKSVIKKFVVLPEGDKQDTGKMDLIVDQIVEEIKMVREFCRDLLVPPTVVALSEFMAAYPDLATHDMMMNQVRTQFEESANAKRPGSITAIWGLYLLGAFVAGAGMVILYGMVVQ